MKRWWWISGALTLGLLVAGASWISKGKGAGGTRLAIAETKDIETKVSVAAVIVPARRAVFSPPYNGFVRKLHVQIGDTVAIGDPVVSLAPSLGARNDEVFPMRASFAGTVVQVLKNEGEYVETGKDQNGLVRVDDLSRLLVTADIPESDIGRIRIGQPGVVRVNAIGERTYRAEIRRVALAAREKKDWSRTGDRVEFEVTLEILDKDERLRPGMSVVVDIVTASAKGALALPHEFLLREKDKYFVTTESGERREVEVGAKNDEWVEVKRGLASGEAVRQVDYASLPDKRPGAN